MTNPTKSIVLVFALAAGFLGGATARLNAQSETHRIRNIVLVHGAWADGSGWKGVYDILSEDGYNVSIVQEPETSFKEDVAATRRILALQNGPCILVAHSYGGPARSHQLLDWYTWQPTCQMSERTKLMTESASPVT